VIWYITEAVVKMKALLILEKKIEDSENAARKNYRQKLIVRFNLCRHLINTKIDC
jgi:hypothetical protein